MAEPSFRDRDAVQDEESGAKWIYTYGDLVTLLLCFFVALYSFSTMDSEKWKAVVSSFTGKNPEEVAELVNGGTDNPAGPGSWLITDAPEEQTEPEPDAYSSLLLSIQEDVLAEGLDAEVVDDPSNYTITLRFNDYIFFGSGQASLLPESRETLDKLINIFAENIDYIQIVRIEGHTDNRSMSGGAYQGNWELSSARAMSALRYLLDSGRIDENKLSLAGYGEFHPIAGNDTEEGRRQNRRVDFIVMSYQALSGAQ